MAESVGELPAARVKNFVPLFVHRFAREQLLALGQVEGLLSKDAPEGSLRLRRERGAQPDGGGAHGQDCRRESARPLGRLAAG